MSGTNKKLNAWWSEDGKWFCVRVIDASGTSTVSLTRDEARVFFQDFWASDEDLISRKALVSAIESEHEEYCLEHGVLDQETGCTDFGSDRKEEYSTSLIERAEMIRTFPAANVPNLGKS